MMPDHFHNKQDGGLMASYFVIRNSDGDTRVDQLTREQLLERLDPSDPYYGSDATPMSEIHQRDTHYWGDGMLIIKGEIVTPTARHVVTKIDLP
jgi:hypothetical protein